MFKNKKYILISSYLDNELNEKDRTFVENKIKNDPEWEKVYNTFRKNKESFQSLKNLPENTNLNQILVKTIEKHKADKEYFIPIPRKYIPLAVSLVITALIFVTLFMLQRKGDIELFFKKNTNIVRNVYEKTFTNHDLYPINASLSNEDVFKFAVYGVLPAENQKDKVIQLGNNQKSGYYVEMADKNRVLESKKQLPLEKVYKELRIDPLQQKKIDNVLVSFKKNIETSILAAPKEFIAVDPDLWNFQKAVVYEISKNLSLKQRKEFYVLTGNPYVKSENYASQDYRKDSIVRAFSRISRSPRDFLVIKPDTMLIKKINVNYDSIKMRIKRLKENNVQIDLEINNILPTMQNTKTVSVRVGKHTDGHNRNSNTGKPRYDENFGVSISIDTAMFRVEIPDMQQVFPDKMVFEFLKDKEFKVLEKLERIKNDKKIQKNFEMKLNELEKELKNNGNNFQLEKYFPFEASDSLSLEKSDTIKRRIRYKYFDDKSGFELNNLNELNKLFKGKNSPFNSIKNQFLNEKNSRLVDTVLSNIKIDSILEQVFKKIQIKSRKN
jgi:hypothetical protein